MPRSEGPFEVALTPQEPAAGIEDARHGRMAIAKRYHGGLTGSGHGQMLTALTATDGSAVYVAIERVTGSLDGRDGGFTLVHRGIRDRGTSALEVGIVPDSGTGALAGIRGRMDIVIERGAHRYVLDYALPDAP
jgi:hypothetical protein